MSLTTDKNTQVMVMQKSNQVSNVVLYGTPIVSLYIEGQERLCLAQISNTLLKQFSYNEIHNRRVALGITCVQCTPVQLEILRRAGAMPVSSRRCGMITRREAERLCKSFLGDNAPPRLPDDFAFCVYHKCAWGCHGSFLPSRYNSSRAKCIKCNYCGLFFSPNKFIFHSHRVNSNNKYVQPDAANFNSWRRHMMLIGQPSEEIIHAWEDVKAMFNGGTRKRLMNASLNSTVISDNSVACASAVLFEKEPRKKETLVTKLEDVGNTEESLAQKQTDQKNILDTRNMQPILDMATSTTNIGSMREPSSKKRFFEQEYSSVPFPQSLVMDYMWHTHMHNDISPYQRIRNNNSSLHSLPLSFLKNAGSSYSTPILLNAASQLGDISCQNRFQSIDANVKDTNVGFLDIKSSKLEIHKASAFKPVLQQNHEHGLLAIRVPTSDMSGSVFFTPLCTNNSITANSAILSNSSISSTVSSFLSSSNTETELTFTANKESLALKLHANIKCDSPETKLTSSLCSVLTSPRNITSSQSEEVSPNSLGSDNEDEMVDIETTEDDTINEKIAIGHSKQRISQDSLVLFTKVGNNSECYILKKNEESVPHYSKHCKQDYSNYKVSSFTKSKESSQIRNINNHQIYGSHCMSQNDSESSTSNSDDGTSVEIGDIPDNDVLPDKINGTTTKLIRNVC